VCSFTKPQRFRKRGVSPIVDMVNDSGFEFFPVVCFHDMGIELCVRLRNLQGFVNVG